MVFDPDGDFVDKEGTLIFLPDEQRKQISLRVRSDNIPELSEKFVVTLLSASGGGDIDPSLTNATVTIRFSIFMIFLFHLVQGKNFACARILYPRV